MPKTVIKNDRPDRVKRLVLSPLVSALTQAFKRRICNQNPAPANSGSIGNTGSVRSIRFETLEPRVLMSGDVNPAALTIAGELSVPGQQTHYEFDVQEARRVVFDSLTARNDLSWTLDGPNGQITSRSFGNTDFFANSAAFELGPGKYKLTIDGQNDALGAFALRMIDADAAVSMTPGVAVSGTLDSGNKTAVYRFNGTAGDRFFYTAGNFTGTGGTSVDWRLIDPYGRQEGATKYATNSDSAAFTLQRTGEYLLLLEGSGANTASVDYGVNLSRVTDSIAPMTLDAVTTANIDQSGKTARFTFSLAEATPILFDKLTDADFNWSLTGPQGTKIARHSTGPYHGDRDRLFDGFSRLALAAGDYIIAVDLDGASTAAMPFRLLSAHGAQVLTTETPTSGRLDVARATQFYKVALTAGDKIYLDGQSVSGGSLRWRLIDPYGVLVVGAGLTSPVDPFVVKMTGEYWLALDGADSNAPDAVVNFSFALNRVPDVPQTLTLGATVDGAINIAGQSTVYRFDLAAPSQLAFDSRSNRADITWSLTGPRGDEVTNRRFDRSDSGNALSAMMLPAGHYRLTVRGSASAVGAFGFKLADLATASAVTLNTPLTGTLTPANSSLAYRFSVAAGDQVSFQAASVTGGEATWRLIDQYGHDVAGAQSLSAGALPLTLAVGGAYTLLVEGSVDRTVALDFNVQLNAAGNLAPVALPAGDPLTLGKVVSGTFATASGQATYRFTLGSASQIVMDTQGSSSSALWSLQGPRGTEVSRSSLYRSDSNTGFPVFSLPAGDYAITVDAGDYLSGNGAYAFRLLDAAAFSPLTLNQQVSANRSPANSTIGYRLAATAGTTLILNSTDNGYYYAGSWRLIDPNGRNVAAVPSDGNGITYAIPVSGTYTLLNEGPYNTSGTANVTFTLAQQTRAVSELTFNNPLSATLAGRQSLADYTFALDKSGTVVFDNLDPVTANTNNLQWQLAGPLGIVSGWRNVGSDDDAIYNLTAGRYTVTLRNTQDTAATYKFRLLDRNAATAITPGAEVHATVPSGETVIYRFNGTAGEHYYFNGKDQGSNYYYGTYGAAYLIDPFGRTTANLNSRSDNPDFKLPATGEYLLVVVPQAGIYVGSSPTRSVNFSLIPKPVTIAALSLDTDVAGVIARPAETVKYSFTLNAPTTVLVDTGNTTNLASLQWSLKGPRGDEASQRSFNSAPNSVLSLPAGTYEFAVASNNLTTGAFGFRLVDTANAPLLTVDAATQLSLAPASHAQAYQMVVDTVSEFMFDPASLSRGAGWRILDRLGNTLRNGSMSSATGPFSLAAGRYLLVVDGDDAAGGAEHYEFTLRRIVTTALPLTFTGDNVGSIDRIGQRYDFSFTTTTPTTVLFDSLTNRADLTWELTGPTGPLRSNIAFGSIDDGAASAPIRLEAAGLYHLRVIPRTTAQGAFGFRLIDVASATAQPLGSAQSLMLDPGSSAKVFSLDGSAGDRWAFNVSGLSGGAARVWMIDPNGTHLLEATAAIAGNTISTALNVSGRHLVVVEGAIGNATPVTLAWSASLVTPKVATLNVGTDVAGSTMTVGVPDLWQLSLTAPRRLVLDALAGAGHNWKIRGADGVVLQTGSFGNADVVVLAAGAYTVEVQADNVAAMGDYGLRMIDVATAELLTLDQATSATLASVHGTRVYRVVTTIADASLTLNAAASNGETGSVRVFDAAGHLLAAQTLPIAGQSVVSSTNGVERLIVIKGAARATAALAYSMTATEAAATLNHATPGDTLTGMLAHQGDLVTYRIKVPFGQSLSARTLVHDAGSQDVSWQWNPVGATAGSAPWWPDVLDLGNVANAVNAGVAAGEYDLSIRANADASAFALQLLDSTGAAQLPAAGTAGRLGSGAPAAIYNVDLALAAALHVQVSTTTASQLSWQLINPDRAIVAGSGTASAVDTDVLAAGRYVLVVSGHAAPADSVDFNVAVTPLDGTGASAIGTLMAGAVSSTDAPQLFRIHVPTGTHIRVHDEGSAVGTRWQLRAAGSSGNWNDIAGVPTGTSDPEAGYPYNRNLAAGDYEFLVMQSGSSAPGKNPFKMRLVDLDNVPVVPVNGISATLADATQCAAYRVDVVDGQTLEINTTSSGNTPLYWTVLDQHKSVIVYGTSPGSTVMPVLTSGRYTILVKSGQSTPGTMDYTLALKSGVLPDIVPGQKIAGELTSAPNSGRFRLKVQFGGYYQLHDINSDPGIRSRFANHDAGTSPSPQTDTETDYNRLYFLQAGDYDVSIQGGVHDHYEMQLVDLSHAPMLPRSGVATTFAPGSDLLVYRFDADDAADLNLTIAGDDASALSWVLLDRYKQIFAQGQGGATTLVPFGTGDYVVEVRRHGATTQSLALTLVTTPVPAVAFSVDASTVVSLPSNNEEGKTTSARYAFTLAQPASVVFDTLVASADNGVNYTVSTADGQILVSSTVDGSAGNPPLALSAGSYVVTFGAPFNYPRYRAGNPPVSFTFRLATLSGTDKTSMLGTPTNLQLVAGGSSQVVRIDGAAGDRIALGTSIATGATGNWRLVAADGTIVFSGSLGDPVASLELKASGVYLLVLSRTSWNATTAACTVSASLTSHTDHPVANSIPITPETTDTISLVTGVTSARSFTVATRSLVSISGSTTGDVYWRLRKGTDFVTTDAAFFETENLAAVLDLQPGDYVVETWLGSGTAADVSLLVQDAANATQAAAGADIVATAPGFFKVDLIARQQYYLMPSDDTSWSVYRPDMSKYLDLTSYAN
ncbi:MAG: hypothetical protein ACI802_003521, partial [Candidatus Paceibacteria bacterium]